MPRIIVQTKPKTQTILRRAAPAASGGVLRCRKVIPTLATGETAPDEIAYCNCDDPNDPVAGTCPDCGCPCDPTDGSFYCDCDTQPLNGTAICPNCQKPVDPEPVAPPMLVRAGVAAVGDFIGKAVFFASEGERVAGKVVGTEGENLKIALAVPGRDGILRVSDSPESQIVVKATDTEMVEAITKQGKMRAFEAGAKVSLSTEKKAIAVYDDDDKTVISDYLNVVIEGYASTFVATTKKDRGGDYILPGAFDRTIPEFLKNPVMLTNHKNKVEAIAGSWSKVVANLQGLAVTGMITNAPGMKDIRFKLMEGHIKGLSIGGIWHYLDDGYGIEDADLFEVSLVAIPMNPDALAHTRGLDVIDCRKAFAKYWRSHTSLRDA